MNLNIDKVIADEVNTIWFDSYVLIDRNMWFPAANYNALFCVKKGQTTAELIIEFKEYPFLIPRIFFSCECIDRKIILIPSKVADILVYDIDEDVLEKYMIPNGQDILERGGLFSCSFVYEGKVYLVGDWYPGIIKFDAVTGIEEVIEEPYLRYKKNGVYDGERFYRHAYVLYENKLYLPTLRENGLICMDMETRLCSFIEVLPQYSTAWDCIFDGKYIWVWGTNFYLAKYDVNSGVTEYSSVRDNDILLEGSAAYLEKRDTDIYIYLTKEPIIIFWNTEKKIIKKSICYKEQLELQQYTDYSCLSGGAPIVTSYCMNERRYLFCSVCNGYISIDDKSEIHTLKYLSADVIVFAKKLLYKYNFQECDINSFLANDNAALKLYLEYVKEETEKVSEKKEINVGNIIHDAIMAVLA